MGKYRTQEQIDEWRRQSGFKTTTQVRAEEIAAREAEQLMQQSAQAQGGEGKADKVIRLLESIERKMDSWGAIG